MEHPPQHAQGPWVDVYRDTIRPLYAYASRRVGGDRAFAEDLVQEAWLRALPAWRDKGAPQDPLAWLTTVVRNLAANHHRRRLPEPLAAGELDLVSETVEPRSPGAAALLGWGLSHLRAGQAQLFEARHLDGKGVAAIARDLGLTERAVEGRLRRARSALRDKLAPYVRASETGAGLPRITTGDET
jgi:RNA polymerase sigma-70 factor (ECF subfamily)